MGRSPQPGLQTTAPWTAIFGQLLADLVRANPQGDRRVSMPDPGNDHVHRQPSTAVLSLRMVKMYRDFMDQAARYDIAAAAAAHHELGPDYDAAVAEGLIERISDEIDKRVDARLRATPRNPRSPAEAEQSARRQVLWTGSVAGAGVGAGITGIAAILADHARGAVVPVVITVWLILTFIALSVTLVRKSRNQGRE